jgi:hypothetical protein
VDLQRVAGDDHRLDEAVRRVLEDPAVLERARLALVGVGAQVVRLAVVELDDRPAGKAAPPWPRMPDAATSLVTCSGFIVVSTRRNVS